MTGPDDVSLDEVQARVAAGAVLLDVRSQAEFTGEAGYPCDERQGHIPGACHVPLDAFFAGPGRPHEADSLRSLLDAHGADPSQELIAYCHSGSRSRMAAAILRGAGLDAVNYAGSWHEWSSRPDLRVETAETA